MCRNNLNISFFNFVEGESLIMAVKDVAVSSGSACTSARRWSRRTCCAPWAATTSSRDSLRSSLHGGPLHWTEQDVDYVINLLKGKIAKLRDLSPLWEMHQ